MNRPQLGFTLIELIAVMVVVGIMSVALASRIDSASSSSVQAGRDDIIAALFFAQQTAMARSGIQVTISGSSVNVTENGNPIALHSDAYPLALPNGVTATAATFAYNKLGKTTPGSITVSRDGVSVTITVEASGYAHY